MGRPINDGNTEWFEALTVEEAKEERIIVGLWIGRVVTLFGLLCAVAYAAAGAAPTTH